MRRNSPLNALVRAVEDIQDETLDGYGGRIFMDMLRDAGFEVLGSGGSRIIVGLGPTMVAKVDVNPEGGSNRDEADFYRWNSRHTDRLAPVLGLEAGGRVLLMARASPTFDKGVPRKYAKELRAAKAEVLPLAEADGKVDPEYDFNWGVVNGAVMCIDYGS
jgi:hypothetical protein